MDLIAELSKGIADEYRQKQQNKLKRTFVAASDAASAKFTGETKPYSQVPMAKKGSVVFCAAEPVKPEPVVPKPVIQPVISKDFPGLIIFETLTKSGELQKCPISILSHTASKNDNWRCLAFNSMPGACELRINNKFLAKATGSTVKESKYKAAVEGLEVLRKTCYTIRVKQLFFSNATSITKSIQPDESRLPQDNIGSKIMQKMGWTGQSGLGKAQQGIQDPIQAAPQIVKRAGLGNTNIRELESKFIKIFKNYKQSDTDDDLVFSPDFSAEERKILHRLAHRYNFKTRSYGSKNERKLVVYKHVSASQLLMTLLNCGGENEKYLLIHPGEHTNDIAGKHMEDSAGEQMESDAGEQMEGDTGERMEDSAGEQMEDSGGEQIEDFPEEYITVDTVGEGMEDSFGENIEDSQENHVEQLSGEDLIDFSKDCDKDFSADNSEEFQEVPGEESGISADEPEVKIKEEVGLKENLEVNSQSVTNDFAVGTSNYTPDNTLCKAESDVVAANQIRTFETDNSVVNRVLRDKESYLLDLIQECKSLMKKYRELASLTNQEQTKFRKCKKQLHLYTGDYIDYKLGTNIRRKRNAKPRTVDHRSRCKALGVALARQSLEVRNMITNYIETLPPKVKNSYSNLENQVENCFTLFGDQLLKEVINKGPNYKSLNPVCPEYYKIIATNFDLVEDKSFVNVVLQITYPSSPVLIPDEYIMCLKMVLGDPPYCFPQNSKLFKVKNVPSPILNGQRGILDKPSIIPNGQKGILDEPSKIHEQRKIVHKQQKGKKFIPDIVPFVKENERPESESEYSNMEYSDEEGISVNNTNVEVSENKLTRNFQNFLKHLNTINPMINRSEGSVSGQELSTKKEISIRTSENHDTIEGNIKKDECSTSMDEGVQNITTNDKGENTSIETNNTMDTNTTDICKGSDDDDDHFFLNLQEISKGFSPEVLRQFKNDVTSVLMKSFNLMKDKH